MWFKVYTCNTKVMSSISHVAFEISFLKLCVVDELGQLMGLNLR